MFVYIFPQVALSQSSDPVDTTQYVAAFLSFFFVVFGGLLVGFIIGAFSALFCKFTTHTRGTDINLIIAVWNYFLLKF